MGGFDSSLGGGRDICLAKFDAAGQNLVWSTYLGGSLPDQLQDVRLDPLGQPTVIGYSVSSNYPVSINAYRTTSAGATEIVATRLNAQGSGLRWSTYFGGLGVDRGLCLAVAADGSTWLGGGTESSNFPSTNGAFQRTLAGRADGLS